ncbi:MAG: single-stranded DNA-binding protein [bacterium]|jgi:single-strand DNA-binding protein
MASLNKVFLIGNVGKDPEVRYVADGVAVANFPIATSERFTDRSGQQQERTEWHNIVVWRKQAEIAGEYVRKGRQLYVEGSIMTRTWTDADNVKHFRTEILCQRFLLLGRKDDAPSTAPPGARQAVRSAEEPEEEELGPPLDYDDNILNPPG